MGLELAYTDAVAAATSGLYARVAKGHSPQWNGRSTLP